MSSRRASGFTLIEMVMAIVIISVGLAGVLTAFSVAVKASADPLVHKQMLSVAEEMMEEILLKPYAVNGTPPANSPSACDGGTPPSREAFDDVADYHKYQTIGVCDIEGLTVPGLESYSVKVSVDSGAALGLLGGGSVIRVTVEVSRGADSISLDGWRTNYAKDDGET